MNKSFRPLRATLYVLFSLYLLPLCLKAQREAGTVNVARIMEKVFTYPARLGLSVDDYSADIYMQFGFRTTRRSRYARFLPGFFRFEPGTNDYFGENHLRLNVHKNAGNDIHELGYFCTYSHAEQLRKDAAIHLMPNIYDSNLFTDRLLSPLNRRNRRFYRYSEEKVLVGNKSDSIVRLRIEPRFYNTQLVTGIVDVDTLSGSVRNYSFYFFYDLSRLHVSGRLGRDSIHSLFPERITVASHSSVLGNKLSANFLGTVKYDFSVKHDSIAVRPRRRRFDLTERYSLRVDTSSSIRSEAYFDTLRTYPLPAEARLAYDAYHEKLAFRRQDTTSLATKSSGLEQTVDFLTDRHRWTLGDNGQLRLPAILTPEMFAWSKRKGFVLQTRMRLEVPLGRKMRLMFTPKASYSFTRRQFYWRTPLILTFAPAYDMQISLEAGRGNDIYNSKQADDVRAEMQGTSDYETLDNLLSQYDFNFYRDFHANLNYAFSPVSGLRLEAGMRYHRRSLMGWHENAGLHGIQRYIRSFAPRFHAEWTPCLYYYRDNLGHKVPLYSRWPTLRFDYEHGIPVGRIRSRYERMEFDAAYVLPLYALRSLYLRLGYGLYTKRGKGYFLDYDYFCDENLPEGWHDEMSGRFYALGSRWYNESRYYARLSATYESPMLVFSRLKFLSRIVQRERIYVNIVSLSSLTPYAELGYGLTTRILDVSAFVGLAPGYTTSLGAHVVLHW